MLQCEHRASSGLPRSLSTPHAGAVPVTVQDPSGRACLLVLPSDRPSPRPEAASVEALLADMLRDPSCAARRACEWRAATLSGVCGASLAALLDIVKGCSTDGRQAHLGQWRFRQAGKLSLTGEDMECVCALVWALSTLWRSAAWQPRSLLCKLLAGT